MPDQTHEQLSSLGIDVDTLPYELSFDDTVRYLASKIPGYDVVISCQNVADIYPALERLHLRPPLIEHGGLVSEALAGPKHFTTRYIGVCRSIRDAAASRMPGREHHALEIPSMVDLSEYDTLQRGPTRASLGIAEDEISNRLGGPARSQEECRGLHRSSRNGEGHHEPRPFRDCRWT